MTRKLEQMAPLAAKYTADEKLAIANEAAAQMSASAPRGETGAYAASIQGDRLSNRAGRASVGGGINQSKDPDATGIFADYIWRFLEFGAIGHVIKAKVQPRLPMAAANSSGRMSSIPVRRRVRTYSITGARCAKVSCTHQARGT